jgi:predicted DNA binding CopG/RHH family protein
MIIKQNKSKQTTTKISDFQLQPNFQNLSPNLQKKKKKKINVGISYLWRKTNLKKLENPVKIPINTEPNKF